MNAERTQELPEEWRDPRLGQVLEEVARGEGEVSQREISRRSGIALGMVNAFLKRLVRKGYVKATTLPRNRLKYFVTPSGVALKTRLTYHYVRNSLSFYRESRRRARAVLDRLSREGRRRVAFLGVGDLAEIAYLTARETGVEVTGVYDDAAAGDDFLGMTVRPESDLNVAEADRILFTGADWPKEGSYRGRGDVESLF